MKKETIKIFLELEEINKKQKELINRREKLFDKLTINEEVAYFKGRYKI